MKTGWEYYGVELDPEECLTLPGSRDGHPPHRRLAVRLAPPGQSEIIPCWPGKKGVRRKATE